VPPGALADADFRAAELARRPPELAARLGETIERVFLRGGTQPEQYLPQVRATAAWLRASPSTAGQKIGVVGFCMGGALAGLYATDDAELGAAAIFYGKSPATSLAAKIRCPVRGFYGASDPPINEGVPALAGAMKRAGGSFEAHVYEGAGHAFFNDARTSYRAGAARDAFARVLDFFRRELAG
jgi:carboxymethylenebutenolidase